MKGCNYPDHQLLPTLREKASKQTSKKDKKKLIGLFLFFIVQIFLIRRW